MYKRNSRQIPFTVEVMDEQTGEVINEVQMRDTRYEYPDPTPLQLPLALQRAESTDDKIKRLMTAQRAWMSFAERADETLEEEDDFDPDPEDLIDPRYVSFYEENPGMLEKFSRRLDTLLSKHNDPDVGPQAPPPKDEPLEPGGN